MIKLAFIGAGNMARALLLGLAQNSAFKLACADRNEHKLDELRSQIPSLTCSTDITTILADADYVVFAVKPYDVLPIAEKHQQALGGKIIISLAAGLSTSRLKPVLTTDTVIIRAMPNTPALIQAGITGLFAEKLTPDVQKTVESIFRAIGKILWLDDEIAMHALTALSGSGPAYFFLFMEALVTAGTQHGLSEAQANELVKCTALGAAKLALHRNDENLASLRREVTSPGGTTAAAIEQFETHAFSKLIADAIGAAKQRSIELDS